MRSGKGCGWLIISWMQFPLPLASWYSIFRFFPFSSSKPIQLRTSSELSFSSTLIPSLPGYPGSCASNVPYTEETAYFTFTSSGLFHEWRHGAWFLFQLASACCWYRRPRSTESFKRPSLQSSGYFLSSFFPLQDSTQTNFLGKPKKASLGNL